MFDKYITRLSDTFSLGGYWWLPADPDKKIYGTLQYLPDTTPELSLDGSFSDFLPDASNFLSNVVIHGITPKGVACTLLDAYQKTNVMHCPGSVTSEFFCNRLFVGGELITSNTFESAIVEFSSMTPWLSRNTFHLKVPKSTNDDKVWGIEYEAPTSISFSAKSIQSTVNFESSIASSSEQQCRTLKYTDYVRFRPKIKQDINWYLEKIFSFRIFLSLLIGQPIDPISIKLCTGKTRIKAFGNRYSRSYSEFCIPHYQSPKIRELYPPDMLFTYSSVRKDFGRYLVEWYRKGEALRTTSQMLFGVWVQNHMPLDFRFLALVQAYESFHRSTNEGKYLSDASYQPIKMAITASIPKCVSSDHKAALESRIRYGNEFSLRKRFDLTLKLLPARMRGGITGNDPQFISKVVSTRNYLTHRDESEKSNVMNTSGIMAASEGLQIMIMMLLLNEVGIGFEAFEKAVLDNARMRRTLGVK